MFVMSNRNIIIPSADGMNAYNLPKGYIGRVPEWVTKTEYFKALVADGKVTVTQTAKDRDVEKAVKDAVSKEEKARKQHKTKVKAEKAE